MRKEEMARIIKNKYRTHREQNMFQVMTVDELPRKNKIIIKFPAMIQCVT